MWQQIGWPVSACGVAVGCVPARREKNTLRRKLERRVSHAVSLRLQPRLRALSLAGWLAVWLAEPRSVLVHMKAVDAFLFFCCFLVRLSRCSLSLFPLFAAGWTQSVVRFRRCLASYWWHTVDRDRALAPFVSDEWRTARVEKKKQKQKME